MKMIILTLFVVVAILFNFTLAGKSNKIDISLKNIKAMQVSASEIGCSPTTQYYCKITFPGGIIEGIGQPFYNE